MMMDVVVEIPMPLIEEAVEAYKETNCIRKQAVFQLFPGGTWNYYWCCGVNRGRGSDNGYGVGHSCSDSCDLRLSTQTVNEEAEEC